MKQNSVLSQIYKRQQQSDKDQVMNAMEQHGNNLFLLRWILIGALVNSIVLAPFVVLYIRQRNNSKTDSTIAIETTATTTPLSFRWNSTGTMIAGTGSAGTAANQLRNPYGLALDSSNSLYIVDRSNNRVQKYLSGALSGSTVAGQAIGISSSTSTDLRQPGYVVVDANSNIYVSDSLNHRIQFWSNGASSGVTIAGTGSSGNGLNQFDTPRGVARNPNTGALYIADQYNDRIMYYASGATSGIVIAGGNGCGSNPMQLCSPVGVQLDSSSNSLFISNFGAHTIVRWVIGATSSTLVAGSYGVSGSSSVLLNAPTGLSLDSMGNIYVADTFNHRIMLFMSGQAYGTTIAGAPATNGSSLSLLSSPFWVSLDAQLNLYVSDRDNQRVLKFIRY